MSLVRSSLLRDHCDANVETACFLCCLQVDIVEQSNATSVRQSQRWVCTDFYDNMFHLGGGLFEPESAMVRKHRNLYVHMYAIDEQP